MMLTLSLVLDLDLRLKVRYVKLELKVIVDNLFCDLIVTGYRIVYKKGSLYDCTILSWGFDVISLKYFYQFWYMKITLKIFSYKRKQCCYKWEIVLRENHVNRESKSLELTIYLYRCYEHESPSSFTTTVYLSWLLHLEDFLAEKNHR